MSAADPLASLPPVRPVPAAEVRGRLDGAAPVVFLDDDPTGTQTIRDLPVLTRWTVEDVGWALRRSAPGFFVLTNARSLGPADAEARMREVVRACLDAAEQQGRRLVFASRSDSTLRGHFPLDTDVIAEAVEQRGGRVDAVLLVPAFPAAGRVTVDGVHWVRTSGGLVPAADTDFAKDATFGFRSSRLADWVEEKSAGRIAAIAVGELTLGEIRTGTTEDVSRRLTDGHQVVAVDAVEDDDLRAVVLALLEAERAGSGFVYRVGPSFVGARVGQGTQPPIEDVALAELVGPDGHGLVVVGSHVALTTRQLARLAERRPFTHVELDVPALLDASTAERAVADAVASATAALASGLVVLSTSRQLVTGADEQSSLQVARTVSGALTRAAGAVVAARRPSYVVAKGGITSSDVATDALGIRRAVVRGSLLPGLVSLWEPAEGPSRGLPYVVFAGNVGDEDALADVIDRLEAR
jgi:uncharacterized protein YgbK (DUF1537 family)